MIPREPTTVEANGIRFSCIEEGTGPLVLLMHGFPDTARTWDHVRPALAERGFRAVSPNLRGYAPTSAPADGDYSPLRLGEDVVALIGALGAERAILVGHDWGALSCYVAANLAPERVEKLVTVAIPHPRAIRPTLGMLWKLRHFVWFGVPRLPEWQMRRDDHAYLRTIYERWSPRWDPSEEDLADVKRCFSEPGSIEAAYGFYKAFLRVGSKPEVRKVTSAKTSVPAMVFEGLDDGAANPADFERSERCFTGPHEIARVPGGHWLHREHPEEFLPRLLDFIGEATR